MAATAADGGDRRRNTLTTSNLGCSWSRERRAAPAGGRRGSCPAFLLARHAAPACPSLRVRSAAALALLSIYNTSSGRLMFGCAAGRPPRALDDSHWVDVVCACARAAHALAGTLPPAYPLLHDCVVLCRLSGDSPGAILFRPCPSQWLARAILNCCAARPPNSSLSPIYLQSISLQLLRGPLCARQFIVATCAAAQAPVVTWAYTGPQAMLEDLGGPGRPGVQGPWWCLSDHNKTVQTRRPGSVMVHAAPAERATFCVVQQ
jgi:hypothetical protein